jgi:hypothetical protein
VAKVSLGEPEKQRRLGNAPRIVNVSWEIGTCFPRAEDTRVSEDEPAVSAKPLNFPVGPDFERPGLDPVNYPGAAMIVGRPVEPFILVVREEHEAMLLVAVKLSGGGTLCSE